MNGFSYRFLQYIFFIGTIFLIIRLNNFGFFCIFCKWNACLMDDSNSNTMRTLSSVLLIRLNLLPGLFLISVFFEWNEIVV